MADGLSHNRKCALSTKTAQVSGAHTDFVVLFTEDSLPSEMFDADGSFPAQNGGGDIRFTSDAAGNTNIAAEVVAFVTDNNPANGRAKIFVKLPNVRDTQVDTIYVWYNTAATDSQPAVTAANGRNAVWSREEVRWHDPSDPVDATGNYTDGNTQGGVTTVTGPWGDDAAGYDGVDDASVRNSGHSGLRLASETTASVNRHVTAWFKADSTSGTQAIVGFLSDEWMGSTRYGTGFGIVGGKLRAISGNANTESQVEKTFTDTTNWNRADLIAETDDTFRFYHNGALVGSGGDSGTFTYEWAVGAAARHTTQGSADGGWFDGSVAEAAYAEDAPSADWITTTWNSENDPGAFITVGTPESVGGGAAVSADNGNHGHVAETGAVSPAAAAQTDPAVHAHPSEAAPSLAQASAVAADGLHPHDGAAPAAVAHVPAAATDAAHAHLAEGSGIVQDGQVGPLEAAHLVVAGAPVLAPVAIGSPFGAAHSHLAAAPFATTESVVTPSGRHLVVPARRATLEVAADGRNLTPTA